MKHLFSRLSFFASLFLTLGISQSSYASLVDYPCQEFGPAALNEDNYCFTLEGGSTHEVLVYLFEYNETERETLRQALKIVEDAFRDFWKVSQDPLRQCVNKYATKDFDANGGMSLAFPERDRKITWAMTVTQFAFKNLAAGRNLIIIHGYDKAMDGTKIEMGNALIGVDSVHLGAEVPYNQKNLNININRVALAEFKDQPQKIAGTIYHEWMHRVGYDHPTGYEGSFIKELGLCISRNNADKGLELSGSSPEMID